MLILFDHGTPAPLAAFLKDHTVKKTKDLGWDTLTNRELLGVAEEAGFEIFLTTDKNIRYQRVVSAVKDPKRARYTEIAFPDS
jgi:biopolymer transport protein ExbD